MTQASCPHPACTSRDRQPGLTGARCSQPHPGLRALDTAAPSQAIGHPPAKPMPFFPELLRFWQVREELTRGLNQRAVARAVKLAFGPPTPAAATALPPPEQMRQGQPSADSLAGYLAS